MKIKSIYMKNFANFSEFTCNLSPNISWCVGSNGAGKSTVGTTAIWACLRGIAERGTEVLKGRRSMWVGRYGTDAEIEIVLTDPEGIDYTVNRKISENKLEITSSDGRKLGQSWINSFFNSMMLSPVAFSHLHPRGQAEYLGIDTSKYDTKIEELKDDAKVLRAIVKNFGEIEVPEKVEMVDIAELSADKDDIVEFNREQEGRKRAIETAAQRVASCESEVERLMQALQIAQVSLDNRKHELRQLPEPSALMTTTEIDQKISAASETNSRAIAYEQALKNQEEKSIKENDLADNLERQKAEMERKTMYMQSLDLPFSNLTINDDGGLMMDGRPIKEPEFSTGECIKICTMLLASRCPDWKYVFLQGFDLLDDVKSKEVLDFMMEKDFQVLAEKVVSGQSEVLILQDVDYQPNKT